MALAANRGILQCSHSKGSHDQNTGLDGRQSEPLEISCAVLQATVAKLSSVQAFWYHQEYHWHQAHLRNKYR